MHRSIRLVTGRRRPVHSSLCQVRSALNRSFHSTAPVYQAAQGEKKKSAVRDTRLAGRVRFYKTVGIKPVAAPWEAPLLSNDDGIESPISAGVDGTQSASGVSLNMPDRNHLLQLLLPRIPNSTATASASSCQWFGVTLDGRSIRTPLGQTLAVPSQHLAWAIATEWDAQKKTLQPAQMPLMTLSCTALDQTAADPQLYKQHILQYLPTDTTCYWADPLEDRVLHRKQQQYWQGIHDWATRVLGAEPACAVGASEGLLMSRARPDKQKASGLPHPVSLVEAAKKWVDTLDAWHLTAMHSVTSEAKSFMVGMALMESAHVKEEEASTPPNPFVSEVSKSVLAARVEEEFQIDNWGLVEGGHDYDRLNCSVQMHSAHFLTSSIATELFLDDTCN